MLLVPVNSGTNLTQALRIQEDLLGPKNGLNAAFWTDEYFIKTSHISVEIYWNGRALTEGVDFISSEPGGPGTGYRNITLLWTKILPISTDSLKANYLVGYGS